MSDGNSEFRMSPGVRERLEEGELMKKKLAGEMDSFNTRLFKAGLNVFKWGVAYPAGFIAEYLMPPGTGWLTRLVPIGIGFGLEKLAKLKPDYEKSKFTKLVGILGGGLYRGGAFGIASSMVLNTIFEPQAGKQFTELAVQGVANMPANKAFVFPGTPPEINIANGFQRLDQTFAGFFRNPIKKLI